MFTSSDDQSGQATGTENDTMLYIGEGKKYSTEFEADKALAFQQDHISNIEAENAVLREQAGKAATIDEVLESIRSQAGTTHTSTTTGTSEHQDNVDIDALVAAAVDSRLTASQAQTESDANAQTVVDELSTRYGSRAKDVYIAKAEELGVNLDDLSRVSPKAVLEYFKESKPTVGSYMSGTQNTSHLNSGNSDHGTYEYWNKQMKAGTITRDKCFAEQHKSIQAMGAAKFYGNS